MNIQEMESSGELNQLRDKWFSSPRQCDGFDLADSNDKFPVDEFIPLTILSAAFIVVAVAVASINRIIWGSAMKDSMKKRTARVRFAESDETVGTTPLPNLIDEKSTPRIRLGTRTVGTTVPNVAGKTGIVHIIKDDFSVVHDWRY